VLGEALAGDDLMAQAPAFLFVGVDSVATPGGHVLTPKQGTQRLIELAGPWFGRPCGLGVRATEHDPDIHYGRAQNCGERRHEDRASQQMQYPLRRRSSCEDTAHEPGDNRRTVG